MPWPWIVFALIVAGMLALDLGVVNRKAHVVGFKEALAWSGVWVALSLAFGAGVWWWQGGEAAMGYYAAYAVEKALSVDNLFVFLLLFRSFEVPKAQEHRVLYWGVIGALAMRAVLIAAGIGLLHHFHAVIYVFGALLLFTGFRLAVKRGDAGVDPARNPVLRLARRFGATPFVTVLVAVETSDLMFAIDSIPAVMAISTDPFVVYTSNVFAILGLRSMYFALEGLMERLKYFSLGLAAVLVFVGIKMLLSDVHPIPTGFSLAVIAGLVGVAIAASLAKAGPSDPASASAGGSTGGSPPPAPPR